MAYIKAKNLQNEQVDSNYYRGFKKGLHCNVCGERLFRSNPHGIPTSTVGIEDRMEICSQDKCIIGSESQVLLDRGCLVDVISTEYKSS